MTKFASILLVAFVAHATLAAPQSSLSKIQPKLQASLKSNDNVDILVSFEGGTAGVLNIVSTQSFPTRASRAVAVSEVLQARAAESQTEVLEFLDNHRNSVQKIQSLWVSNQIYVRGASADLVQAIAEFSKVSEIKEDEWIPLADVIHEEPVKSPRDAGILAEWGVDNIRAPQVWSASNGNDGAGVIVSTIDTGVLVSHQALASNYIGDAAGGWRDPYQNTQSPNDQNGHGTHCTGTISGAGGIGVAPGARWAACKGCVSSCSIAALTECAQWSVCPNSPSCSSVPHVSSNSWAGGQADDFYDASIDAMKAAGIVVVFANGNSGPACSTANSPADYDGVIGVGSTTNLNALSSFSSKGPSRRGTNKIKPDISAPGSSVNSSYIGSNSAYALLSGTSMACPHVAGTVALLLSANSSLTHDQVAQLLYAGASTNLVQGTYNCGGISDSVYPNYSFGYGKVDAFNSFNALMGAFKA